ncbi:MAG TPA: PA2169 family four-helix-bundle protein [Acidimicrobiia bacterium]|nr:PA2169 family four-helix-bundle protein [Acidimicrobiia bacterium]
MSSDMTVTKDLIETLEDGKNGFAAAAEKLAESDRPQIASKFREYSNQRAQFAEELRSMAKSYGDDISESGSVGAALHRGWMAVKDAATGSDAGAVLDVAEQGEDHAVAEYERALDSDELSIDLREVIQRQYASVKAAHDEVRTLRDSN